MAEYFTSEHFELLHKWNGKKRETGVPENDQAYDELKQAYEVTETWAKRAREALFPMGRVDCRKRPTNQANNYTGYNWARIYPSADAPENLAYTVGIEVGTGFVVKIDTAKTDDDKSPRREYLKLRESHGNDVPFVAKLSQQDGLRLSLDQLVDWSIKSIHAFTIAYDDLAVALNVAIVLSDEDLLRHFDSKPAFQTFRAAWDQQETAIFCRLARVIHSAGLDWWHMGAGIEVRFGRKEAGAERAAGVLGAVFGTKSRKLRWTTPLASVAKISRETLTQDLVSRIEEALTSEHVSLPTWIDDKTVRPGFWPDQLRDDVGVAGGDDDDQEEGGPVSGPAVNRIYYGPPGTGKTYTVLKELQRSYEQPLTAVSIAEWQAQVIATDIVSKTWWEVIAAALYDLGNHAKVAQLRSHPFIRALVDAKGRTRNIPQTLWGTLQQHTVDDSKTVKMKKRIAPAVFDKDEDSTWLLAGEWMDACEDLVRVVDKYRSGPPPSGTIKRYTFVTFHQSYGYEEFVEGLRPVLDDDGDEGQVRYEIRAGTFKELCRKARLAPGHRFAIVIDEINRGNISKIFGELITMIEPDKRDGSAHRVEVTLPYSGEKFSVPANVDILGTMNTADRSLALLDTALRRRFEFEPVMPDTRDEPGAPLAGLRVVSAGRSIDVPQLLRAMNERIEALYDRDHCIGHAYFTPLAGIADEDDRWIGLQQLFKVRIVPLLEEYFFEDWQKIRLVLADNQKPGTAQFFRENEHVEADMTTLFGQNHGLDSYATRRRHTLQVTAFSDPDAYIGIYQKPSAQ